PPAPPWRRGRRPARPRSSSSRARACPRRGAGSSPPSRASSRALQGRQGADLLLARAQEQALDRLVQAARERLLLVGSQRLVDHLQRALPPVAGALALPLVP